MKNIIFLLTFMLLSINVFSQIATRTAVKAQVYTSSGTSPNFNVEILTSDDLSKFDATSVATGDFLYVIDGSDCYELVIDSVYSAAGNLLSISVYDADSVLTTIPTGQAAIVSPYQNYDLPFYVSTLREDLQSCIIQKMISRIDLIISGSTSTQEVLYPLVINKTGTDIFRGQVVMVDTSVLVQGDRMRIMLADNTLPANYIVGVASQDIPHNTEGFVTWFGYVNEVIHSNIAATGVTLDIGDILYISSEPGKYTDTEPLAPKLNSTIAIVIRKPNDSNITLLVRPWLNETLGELTDVDLTNLQDGNTIVWNNATKTWVKSSIDTSATNEIQNLSLSGQTLSISGSNNVSLPVVEIMPANGIDVASTNGVYTITNTKPDTTVTLNAGSNVTITGTYPTFNISSLNTTYSAGTGLSLTGTTFSHNAHTGDVTGTESLTVVGLQGRMLTSAIPSNGQILKWNSTTSKWELGEDELGAPGTSDGVVTSIEVTGTTTKTITLTRSQSLSNLTATFSDLTTNYTAGAGISIISDVISNTAPDVPVVLNSGGIVNITGSYPTFTISATETDGSTTNELQSLSLSGQNLEISNGNSVLLPVVGITAGTGISAVNTTGNVTITNTLPESTSARNINGDGESIFSNQNGSVLNFRKIAVGGSIFVGGASSDSTLYLQGIDLTSARNVNPGGMLIPKNIYIDEEVNELRFRPLVEGYGILITEADSNLTFRVDTSLLSTKTWVSTRGYITSENDGSVENEGKLSVSAGTSTSSIINSNTLNSTGITVNVDTGLGITETSSSITLTNTLPEATTARNIGTGNANVFRAEVGNELQFKKLVQGSNVTITEADSTITIAASSNPGTVTSITAGAGILADNVAGGVITTSGTLSAVDASLSNEGSLTVSAGSGTTSIINSNTLGSTGVTLSASTGLTISETGNTITLTNSSPDRTVTIAGSTGITATGTYPDFSLSVADQSATNELQTISTAANTVTLSNSGGSFTVAGAGINTVNTAGTTITVTGTEQDGSRSNEGSLSVLAGASNTSIIRSNTELSTDVTLQASTGLSITETGNTITLTNTSPNIIQTLGLSGRVLSISGANSVNLPVIGISGGTGIDVTSTDGNFTITNSSPESTTARNLNTSGEGIFYNQSGSELRFKELVQGTNITLVSGDSTITINSTATNDFGTVAPNKIAFGADTGDTLTSNNLLHWDNANGFLGIGTSSPSQRLTVNGNIGVGTYKFYSSTLNSLIISDTVGTSNNQTVKLGIGLLTGTQNTGVGAGAGGAYTGLATSVFIGRNATASGNDQINQIVIGANNFGRGSNTTVIGNQSTISTYLPGGSLMINSALTPSRTLHVTGEARITDLTTDTPTRIVGADADGDLGEIIISTGLSLSGSNLTVPTMTGATVSVNGTSGLVPTPLAGQNTLFLRGDGTWANPTTGGDNWGSQVVATNATLSGNGLAATPLSLASGIVTTGTYRSVTVDTYGRVTAGTNPTTLSGYGITDALSNSTTSTQNGYFGDIYLYDDNTPSHYLQITNSGNLTGTKLLNINVMDADKSIILSGNLTVSANADIQGTNTGDQTITLSGDVTGSGTGPITTTLANSGVTAGTYTAATVTVDNKGRVTSASSNTIPTVNNATLTLNTSGTGLSGSQTFTANQAGNATFTIASNATSANTANTIVARDALGNFTAGTITGALSGNATTASTLQNARTIQTNLASTSAASFNGSTNITPGVTGTLPIGNGGTGATTAGAAIQNLLPSYTSNQSKVLALNSSATALEWVANQSSGVTGTGAANKVAFWTGANTLSNNTNLHWDNTNGRLGINNTSPSERLQVGGNVRAERFIINAFGAQTLTFSNSAPTNAEGYNVFINQGNFQLTASTSTEASRNLGIGYASLTALTTGSQNTAYGVYTASNLTTGSANSAIGTQALFSLTTGGQNFGIGTAALAAIVTESENVAIGHTAGYQIRGNANTLIGSVVAQQITTGSNLTAIGGYAALNLNGGGLLTSASNGVFIGYGTRASANGNTNEVVLGYEGRGNGSNTTTLGNTSTTGTFLAAGNLNLTGQGATAMQTARHTTAGQPGNNLTIKVGGAASGATDAAGGNLILESGVSTGNAVSNIIFRTPTSGLTGNTDNALSNKMIINSQGNIGIGEFTNLSGQINLSASTGEKINLLSGSITGARAGFGIATNDLQIYNANNTSFTWRHGGYNQTEAMRLDGSGNLGVGTSSPNSRIEASINTNTVNFPVTTFTSTVNSTGTVASGFGNRFLFRAELSSFHPNFEQAAIVTRWANVTSGAQRSDMGLWVVGKTGDIQEIVTIENDGDVGINTGIPKTSLHIDGAISRSVPVTVTGNYTVNKTTSWIICQGTGTITLTLPTASDFPGRELMIKTINAQAVVSSGNPNVSPLAGGSLTNNILSATAGKWATLVSDGSNWIIMQGN